ncbi:VOC family protein [Nonomuraea sp. NPDC049714]|uniref:VOC family protein n=1 Tax=Nonomuraea sp. NPDC049714 TaxID=3364357 RepID=UPI0037A3E346
MTTIGQISLGVTDDVRAGEFWRRALGYVRRPPRFEGDDWIVLEPPPGRAGLAPAMDVSETRAEDFPRTHLDLSAEDRDLDDEADRPAALGARRVDRSRHPENPRPEVPAFVVLADPEGNRFCVEGRRRGPEGLRARPSGR